MKKARVQPRTVARSVKKRRAPREDNTSLESFVRLERSAMVFLIFAYCAVHWAIRLATSPVYTIEEADQLLLSQSFQLGYEARQPPMIAWLNALGALAGPSHAIVYGIKYLLMFAGLVVYYLAARNVLVRPGVSAAAVCAWALTFQVGWGMHEDLLGGVALMACLSMTLHAITRILAWRRNRDWLYLGAAIGLGLLTHHLFVVFPLALFLAIWTNDFFRGALTLPKLVTTLAVAALIYSPYAVWVMTHVSSIADAARGFAASWEIDGGWLERARNGAGSLGLALMQFTLPLTLFWAFLFWALWLPILYPVFARRSTDEEPHETAWRHLFARAMLFAGLAYIIGILAGVQVYKGYWILPVLFTFPIWMFCHVKRAGDFPIAIRGFAAVVITLVFGVMVGRIVEWRFEVERCDEACRPYTPIEAWADELRNSGFSEGTIVGADVHLTGNLRGAFPNARVLDAAKPPSAYPAPKGYGACLAVWRDFAYDEERRVALIPQELNDYLSNDLKTPPRDPGAEGAIRRNLRLSDSKAATLYFQFVPPSESCR